MARFLSEEWFEEVARHSPPATDPALGGPAELTIEQVVTAAPEGEVRYHLELRDGGLTVNPGPAPQADARLTEDYATAAEIAQGELSTQAALLAGRIRVGGDMAALAAHRRQLSEIDPIPPAVRAATTY